MGDITEHALLIVKPDGVRHPEFPRILERRLADRALRQVATRDLIMSRDQARTFWRKGDVEEYIAYLREGPLTGDRGQGKAGHLEVQAAQVRIPEGNEL